jgi:hypothetical protein
MNPHTYNIGDSELQQETQAMSLSFDLTQAILLKWYQCVNAIGKHEYYMLANTNSLQNTVIVAVRELYYCVRSAIDAELEKKKDTANTQLLELKNKIRSTDINEVLSAWAILDTWLYAKGITKFDNKIAYERTRAEVANKMRGFD